jgi:O-antigen/teichoic acid export membrane protein
MKIKSNQILNLNAYDPKKFLNFLIKISAFGSLQLFTQALSVVTGILVLRLSNLTDYGLYVFITATVGMLGVISDGGVGPALLSEIGKRMGSKEQIGAILDAARKVRNKLSFWVILTVAPYIIIQVTKLGASWPTTILLFGIVVFTIVASIELTMLSTVLRVHDQIIKLQKLEAKVALSRLITTVLAMCVCNHPNVPIIIALFHLFAMTLYVKRLSKHFFVPTSCHGEDERIIWQSVKDIMPASIYWSLNGNITVFLLGIKGQSYHLGQLGGLGRISQIFQAISSWVSNYTIPSMARAATPAEVRKIFFQSATIFAVLLAGIVGCVMALADVIFFVIGSPFKGLNYELALGITSTCLSIFGGLLFCLCAARGWRMPSWVVIPPNFLTLCVCVWFLDTGTLQGALTLSVICGIPSVLLYGGFGLYKIKASSSGPCLTY